MILSAGQFVQYDLAAVLTATLSGVSCALLGTLLLLRRQALMGDAISHAVLPGLAAAFLLSQSRDPMPMFLGAAAAGLLTALASEGVRRYARVEPGAAMGVVFSAMFALGVLLMSTPAMRLVDLDADCVLSGVMETIVWTGDAARGVPAPTGWASLADPAVLAGAPRQAVTAAVVLVVVALVIGGLFKELRLACFDPALAASLGFRPGVLGMVIMTLTALASVAAFEAVGSILVVAMLVCPAAGARMLTDRLASQLIVSAGLALVSCVGGYFLATLGPHALGFDQSVSAAGGISVVAGLVMLGCILLAPRHGALAVALRRLRLSVDIAREDLLAMLYRLEESGGGVRLSPAQARAALGGGAAAWLGVRGAVASGQAGIEGGALGLLGPGRAAAARLVRTHRLWEVYLVERLGLRPDHVHRTAMSLEHHTSPDMAGELEALGSDVDPHGKPIPRPE